MADFSPMMRHYLQMKDEYPDFILFYRLGDFYEMFFEDAKTVSKELELTLTGRACGQEERAPMCGVPFHSADIYIARLVEKGYRVAICEQMEDPKEAKGIVKREVIRIITPGTNINGEELDEKTNNYLCGIIYSDNAFGLSFCDVSTGEFFVTELSDVQAVVEELKKFAPAEIICNEPFFMSGIDLSAARETEHIAVLAKDAAYFDEDDLFRLLFWQFAVKDLKGLGLSEFPLGALCGAAVLKYLKETQKSDLANITKIGVYVEGNYMMIDAATRRNLELLETMRDKKRQGSLLWVLDKTKTAMGARKLRQFIEQPLIKKKDITRRQDGVRELLSDVILREELREYLDAVYDLERLVTRVVYHTANPRDMIALRNSLAVLSGIRDTLGTAQSSILKEIYKEIDPMTDICDLLSASINEDAPVVVHGGGIIKEGFLPEVDKLRSAKDNGKNWIADLAEEEKEKTGIKNLKINFNKVFGFYFEVTNSYKDLVPDYFIRKQTLANAERFYTPRLKELENEVLGAEEKLYRLEYDLYRKVLDQVSEQIDRIQRTAKQVALLDVLQSFAFVASNEHYVCPTITTDGVIDIKNGRHPVIERMIDHQMFIANDTYLDNKDSRISIITGPNMAGKSTYMRQTALLVLMAQIGSFIPCDEAKIGIVDRIFTRVGASDDLASGQSTFMVEMNEVANILRHATKDSLLILDEIGRGTSTFDGLAIAWAVVEYISDKKIIGAKTLFATHYHELTELEGKLAGVHNYCIAVKENGDDIVFLRKIVPGGADKSYGIQVARLAGVPEAVTERAKAIVEELLANDIADLAKNISVEGGKQKAKHQEKKTDDMQISLFDFTLSDPVVDELKRLDITNMTPVEALLKLQELQNKVRS
ncbi:MAG: DNA mismatch repair protein MutS [Lachnospiraceae bacterium]|nr:DNA mismatch repair protein MutS [Lachnospiraceae bacterium]